MKIAFRRTIVRIVHVTLLLGTAVATAPAGAHGGTYNLDIPSQSLDDALQALALAAQFKLLYSSQLVAGKISPSIKGQFTAEQALSILLSGTKLSYEFTPDGLVLIRPAGDLKSSKAGGPHPTSLPAADLSPSVLQLAQSGPSSQSAVTPDTAPDASGENSKAANAVEAPKPAQIVVTGTNIRGAPNPTSLVLEYSRDDIDRSGVATVQEFLQKLPQNFNGGASEGTLETISGGGNAANSVNGSGVNLRGLGSDSTLVLIDGRRVAPGNSSGNFVDISLIPLSAVQRIEVLPDGASAIYGSDAIGGVVNFIMRHDFEGAETRAGYRTATDGHPHEAQVGQTLGRVWGSGSALVSLEYDDRSALFARDRSYTATALEPFTLLPKQEREGLFATANQTLSPDLEVFADATYSHRSSFTDVTVPAFTQHSTANINTYTATAGGRVRLSDRLDLEVNGSHGESTTNEETLDPTNGIVSNVQRTNTGISSLDGKLQGTFWNLPAGPLLFAAGGQYRRESFDSEIAQPASRFEPNRTVSAAFLEVRAPLIGPAAGSSRQNLLELSFADRFEHYSDFGSTNNPKVGLAWKPVAGTNLRATYGTSFKAPLLNDLNPVPFQVVALPEFDPLTNGFTNSLVVFGGNPDLRPEKARTWTLGVDWLPSQLEGLRASATYYNITFRDRITNAQFSGFDITDALRIENVLGPQIVQRNPSASQVQSLAATSGYVDFCNPSCPLATIGAIVDSRQLNLSRLTTSGIDLSVSYRTYSSLLGRLETGLDGTYIFKFDNRITQNSPFIKLLDTPFNPTDLKLRARTVVQQRGWTFAAFCNYVSSYTDNRNGASAPVSSWTTFDASVGYQVEGKKSVLRNTSAILSAVNIANRAPPHVISNFPGQYGAINYDGANANVLGRIIGLHITKAF